MEDTQELYKKHSSNLSFNRFSANMRGQFDTYLSSHFPFLNDLQRDLRINFQEMDEEDEVNAFFEMDTENLLNEVDFHIVNFDEFRIYEQPDKVKELLNEMKEVLMGNLKNNETALKTINNMKIIEEFFDSLDEKDIIAQEELAQEEKDFNMTRTAQTIKPALAKAVEVVNKMMKAVTKAKRTQITFTIEDTVLSGLIQEYPSDQLTVNDILKAYDSCNALFERILDDINETLELNLKEKSEELDLKVKNIAGLFFSFFSKEDNQLGQFLTACYVFREQLTDRLADRTSVFANLFLKKLTAYRTFAFVNYYRNAIEKELTKNIQFMTGRVKRFFDAVSPIKEYESVVDLHAKTSLLLTYLKNALTAKRTTEQVFNNDFLNDNVPVIIDQLAKFDSQMTDIKRELGVMESIAHFYDKYLELTAEMKLVSLKNKEIEDKLNVQKALRDFYRADKRLQEFVFIYKDVDSVVYRSFVDVLEGNRLIAEEYKALYFQLNN